MAWFHFCTANHIPIGRSSLIDQADWFSAGLLDLGHRVTFSERDTEPNAINLFWECFTPASARWLADQPVHYGIIATEIPDGRGFNWRTDRYWQERFNAFPAAASKASFIWALVESAVPFYQQFCPTVYTELGFSERLIPSYINQIPSADFCFFGQRNPYREAVLGRISQYTNVICADGILPADAMHLMIAQSKIGLNLKQSPQWPVPSGPRFGRLMMAKRGVASEYLAVPTRQGEIAGTCAADTDFVDYAMSLLPDWRRRAEHTFEKYRELMPMSKILENAIDQTVSRMSFRSRLAHLVKRKCYGAIDEPCVADAGLACVVEADYLGHNIVAYQDLFWPLPVALGPIDLANDAERSRFVGAATLKAARKIVRRATFGWPGKADRTYATV